MSLPNFSISECCKSLEVYYDTPEMEHTRNSIYGFYVQQNNKTNGRNWYRNDARSIWWDDEFDNWKLGPTTSKASSSGYAKLDNDGSCLPKIPNQNWKIFRIPEDPWISAGNNVKVRCGYKPEGK